MALLETAPLPGPLGTSLLASIFSSGTVRLPYLMEIRLHFEGTSSPWNLYRAAIKPGSSMT